jgi:ABC-type nitrate/sulfonate/bicarbonate transport system permease component
VSTPRKVIQSLAVPALLVALWWVLSSGSTSPFFPPLRDILEAFRTNWLFGRLDTDVVPSLLRMLAGYAIALALGIAIGLPLGLVTLLRSAFEPVVEYLRALPVVALIPLFIVVTGIGDLTKVLVIALGAVWPILLNTQDGVGSVEPELRLMAVAYRLTLWQRIWRIVLPSALPQIFAGARTALAISFIVMVISEMLAATNGIGYFVLQSQSSFAITDMWSGIILLGVLGYLFNLLFLAVQHRVLRWHTGYRASELANNR